MEGDPALVSAPAAWPRHLPDERAEHVRDRGLGDRGDRRQRARRAPATHALTACSLPSSRQHALPAVRAREVRSLAQQRERFELVARPWRAAGRRSSSSASRWTSHLVLGVGARGPRSAVAASIAASSGPRSSCGTGQRRDPVARGAVVVIGEDPRELAVPVGLHAERAEHEQRLGEGLVGEELVERALPPVLERHRLLDRIEHLEARRERRLERMLGEDPLGERVQGRDRGVVERVQRAGCTDRRRARPAASCSTCSRMRSWSSLAAAVVNVMTPISFIGISRRRPTTRSTSSWVLPVPAPATTFRVRSSSLRIRSRAAWSAGTRTSGIAVGSALMLRPRAGPAGSTNCSIVGSVALRVEVALAVG